MNETENKPEAGGIAVDRLRTIVERIERLEEERKGLEVIPGISLQRQNLPDLMFRDQKDNQGTGKDTI